MTLPSSDARPARARRNVRRLALLAAPLLLAGCAWLRPLWPFGDLGGAPAAPARPAFSGPPPVVFVHGNGDNAALWQTTVWRFESNGWPRERLFAPDLPYPLARDDDTRPQPGRSSTVEQMQALRQEVDRVLQLTGAPQVMLVANSRGGNTVRHLVTDGGQAARVSHAVLGGTPAHGVWADPADRPNNEFNGAGPFLRRLNQPKGPAGDEVTPGIRWLTLRSDGNDKYAQPTGEWIGARGRPTHVNADGPALRGATNVVLPGADHRETSYGPAAFAQTWRFLTGQAPSTGVIVPEPEVRLGGKVFGLGDAGRGRRGEPTNLPLAGASVEVHALRPEDGSRIGAPLLRQAVGADGRWGPVRTDPRTPLEFVVAAPGYATHHVYRSPFPRSSSLVHLTATRIGDAERDALTLVSLTRPRGYFGIPRDEVELDGRNPPPGIPAGVAGVASSTLALREAPGRTVVGRFNGERVVGRTWPAVDNHVVTLELTH